MNDMSAWSAGARPLTDRLNRLSLRSQRFDDSHPLVWDLLLTGFFVVAAIVDASGGWRNTTFNQDVPVWLVFTLSLGFSVPLLRRRRRPLTVLLAQLPFALVNSWSGAHLQASLLQLVSLYGIALRLPLRTLVASYVLVAIPITVGATRFPVGSWDQQFVPQLNGYLIVALIGLAVRARREHLASLVARARQLELERDQQARLATAAERARIAREMHDIIGHNLSVITGLADGGAYAAAKSPERAAQALEAIGTTSRQALAELRRLLDVLREAPGPAAGPGAATSAELAPQPGLSDLDRLVEGAGAAGLPIRFTVDGTPRSVPAGRQLTVYRIVQESLTNTLKHAGPAATATVDVTYGPDAVSVTVTDTGRGRPVGTPVPPAGRGLTGMRERTELYGGTLEAGPLPAPGVGWRVRLHLPKDTEEQ